MFEERSVTDAEHASRVRAMFANIANRYDLLNHLLSVNLDKRWRSLVASRFYDNLQGDVKVLDVACGTGDLSLKLFEREGAQVFGTDFCRPMLDIAARKASAIFLIESDALNLPFTESSFDGVTIAFGLRNLSSPRRGLEEIFRVLKPGCKVAILEFSQPVFPGFRQLFQLYFHRLLPLVGGLVSGSRSAYRYLPASVSRFPDQKRLVLLMREVGFDQVEYQNLTGGVAAIHLGRRPQ